MKLLTKLISSVMILALLSGCMMTANTAQVQPDAGQWKTWVLTSSNELRPAAPPDQAATQAELKQVQAAVAGRTDADLQTIAYWDSGAPSYRWLEATFNQNRPKPASGPRVTRMLSLLNVAEYDAMVAAWDAKYTFNRARPGSLDPSLNVLAQHTNSPSYPSEQAVAAGAASTILAYVYPDQAQKFADMAQTAANSRVLAGAAFPSDVAAGLELGRQVAQKVIDRAKPDDALTWDGVIPTGAGHWTGEKPVEPMAGQWKSWVLTSADEFRPKAPSAYDSPELAAQLQEVQNYTRTWQVMQNAEAWQLPDGAFQSWYDFANLRIFEQGLDANPPAAARIYALMAIAQYDAQIAVWDAKYTYWSQRPFQLDPKLATIFPTPNYPNYPSGHSGISTAMSEILAAEFPAYADTVHAKAANARESRIAAGIHFREDVDVSKIIGEAVAQKVLERDSQMVPQDLGFVTHK